MKVNTSEPDPLKVPVVRRDGWTIYLELVGTEIVGHIDVHLPLTPRRVEQITRDIDTQIEMLGGPIWAPHLEEMGQKHLRFLALIGYEYAFTAPRANGPGEVHIYTRKT